MMSHVVTIKGIKISDLNCLEEAAKELGCELVRGQKSHLFYAGSRKRCDHAVRVVGNQRAYEIGVIEQKDGTYTLQADFYNGGLGLVEAVGEKAELLYQEYAVQVDIQAAARRGFRVIERTRLENGDVILRTAN
jgi:hypothetical protein